MPEPSSSNPLYARGPQRAFSGAALAEVAFPLGGIGTGTVSLGGRGQLRDWEIFNRPGKGKVLPYTFFALWARPVGGPAVARVLERRLLPSYARGSGLPTATVSGLPRLKEARFRGEYPFAWIEFEDEALPLSVSLEAFNPFIPGDADASGQPVALFRWTLANRGPAPVEASVAFSLMNAAGYDGQASLGNRHSRLFGQNLNEWVEAGGARGLRMTTAKYAADDPQFGSMAVATDWPETTYLVRWERAGWWDDLQAFWDDFSSDGRLPSQPDSDPSPENQTDVGSLGLGARVPPGGSVTLPFLLAWHFPNLSNYWNGEEAVRGKRLGNYYATKAADAWDAARQALAALPEQEAKTRRFHQTLFESTLPAPVLDAVSSQASIIRTTTCLRTADGRFHAFEGCNDNAGCCPLDCTHVWNYEQSLAHLFPALERTMRETDFGHNTRADGNMAFRTLVPLIEDVLWGFKPAADGQMGTVLKLYREWQFSGDEAFLRRLWPEAKRALEFAWSGWDADRDGVMEGEQHNTYDIEFYGPNTMMGTLYLAALEAGARMAEAVGDAASAQTYRDVAHRGAEKYDADLWNGAFYLQTVIPPRPDAGDAQALGVGHPPSVQGGDTEPRYQYGPGCLSDQMLGQWFAHAVGLGFVLPQERVRETMRSIFRHNFRRDLSAHASCQRTYALNDEAGLLLCTWPNGGRPAYPFPYADEVWTGIEYQVAGHLIYEGLLEEGLEIVAAVRSRHDGERRNPWDEFECGHHYARAMASWSLLTALSGYQYSAPEQSLQFAPRLFAEQFRCLFTAGDTWGSFSQELTPGRRTYEVEVRHGELALRRLIFAGDPPTHVQVQTDGRDIAAIITPHAAGWAVMFDSPVALRERDSLQVTAA